MKYFIVLLALFIIVSICLPAWDYNPPSPAKDIADTVVVLPDSIYREYGFTDRTTVYGNIQRILLALQTQQALIVAQGERIKVLEIQVRALAKKKVVKIALPPGHIVDLPDVSICEHIWTPGASQDYAQKMLSDGRTPPIYYYTCVTCGEELGLDCEMEKEKVTDPNEVAE